MTQEIATVVASMLRSSDLFQVDSGEVWIPDLDSYAFRMQEHITRALELHGYSASASTRAHHGLLIDVPRAESLEPRQIKAAHSSAYGYIGRVTEIGAKTGNDPGVDSARISEPGNILQIPEIGWTDGAERVVVGDYSGLQLAKVNSNNAVTYTLEDTFSVETSHTTREMSIYEMAENSRVIIFKGEWTGYPQGRFS